MLTSKICSENERYLTVSIFTAQFEPLVYREYSQTEEHEACPLRPHVQNRGSPQ